jgi:hypothetical protein
MVPRRLDPFRGHSLPEVFTPPLPPAGAAVFSPCGGYRWWLQRTWQPERPTLVFVGLNPSCADGQRDDPTLRRLVAYGRRWGFGRLEVINLFGAVATTPMALKRLSDPVGADNEAWIRRCLRRLGPWRSEALSAHESAGADPVGPLGSLLWLGWGNGGAWRGRDRALLALVGEFALEPFALCCTASGQPRHPLYCPAAMTPGPFAPSWGEFPDSTPSHAPCSASVSHPLDARGRP